MLAQQLLLQVPRKLVSLTQANPKSLVELDAIGHLGPGSLPQLQSHGLCLARPNLILVSLLELLDAVESLQCPEAPVLSDIELCHQDKLPQDRYSQLDGVHRQISLQTVQEVDLGA